LELRTRCVVALFGIVERPVSAGRIAFSRYGIGPSEYCRHQRVERIVLVERIDGTQPTWQRGQGQPDNSQQKQHDGAPCCVSFAEVQRAPTPMSSTVGLLRVHRSSGPSKMTFRGDNDNGLSLGTGTAPGPKKFGANRREEQAL